MAERVQPTENQALVRLSILVVVILLAVWVYDRARPLNHHINPSAATGANDLKVETSGSTPGSLQQSANPVDNSSSVQSSQSDLQPAQNSSQLPEDLKKELGL